MLRIFSLIESISVFRMNDVEQSCQMKIVYRLRWMIGVLHL